MTGAGDPETPEEVLEVVRSSPFREAARALGQALKHGPLPEFLTQKAAMTCRYGEALVEGIIEWESD